VIFVATVCRRSSESGTARNWNLACQSMAFTINMIGHVVEIKLSTFIKP